MDYENDDYNVDEEDYSSHPEGEEAGQQQQEEEKIQLSKAEWQQYQQQLEATNQKLADLGKVFTGDNGQPAKADPQAILNLMLTDPVQFTQGIVNQARNEARSEASAQAIYNQAKLDNPDLIPYEDIIGLHFQQYQNEQVLAGNDPNKIPLDTQLKEAIKRTRERLKLPSPTGEARAAAAAATRNFGVNSTAAPSGRKSVMDMGHEEFETYRDQRLRGR